jgi:GNAT superfamily N-acetyltransferase
VTAAPKTPGIAAPSFVVVAQDDPLAGPLLDELGAEYATRYGEMLHAEYRDLRAHDGAEFAAPDGALLIGVVDGEPVVGGAFRRHDATTAELKRIWTSSRHRRRGYGRLLLAELERIAADRGYARLYLITGPRQPEAVSLYLSTGYRALYDTSLPPERVGAHAFDKDLPVPT